MKNTISKIEQLSQKYYPIIRNFPLIKEFSIKRLRHSFNAKVEEEKTKNFIIKNAEDFY
jgi:hypothetical protein